MPGLALAPYEYTRTADDVNGDRVLDFPEWLAELGPAGARRRHGNPRAGGSYTPDTALVNYYDGAAKMGMHQDKDERPTAPWCRSASATPAGSGSATPKTATKPYTDIDLRLRRPVRLRRPSPVRLPRRAQDLPGHRRPASAGWTGPAGLNLTMRVTGLG